MRLMRTRLSYESRAHARQASVCCARHRYRYGWGVVEAYTLRTTAPRFCAVIPLKMTRLNARAAYAPCALADAPGDARYCRQILIF